MHYKIYYKLKGLQNQARPPILMLTMMVTMSARQNYRGAPAFIGLSTFMTTS